MPQFFSSHLEDDQDDEMLGDLHSGVEALREASHSQNSSLTDRARETMQRLESAVPLARSRIRQWKVRVQEAALKTDKAVHEHPWSFVAGAFGLGILIGMLVSSSGSEDEEKSDNNK